MKLAIASDHAGIDLKALIIEKFSDIEFIDVGTYSNDSCDYPDFIAEVGYKIQNHEADLGIVVCGTGIGASIVVNKMKGIRAALCFNEFMADMARKHNNANVLALGARVIGTDLAVRIVEKFLESDFEGGRHQRRLDKITGLEDSQSKL